jgi:hypothetical protein
MNVTSLQTPEMEVTCTVRHAVAWVGMCAALAVHVVDEALTDFLSVYNPAIISLRERLPWLPLPAFTFEAWLGGLIIAVILLTVLTVFVLRGAPLMTPLSYAFGALMLGNGLLHVAGSLQLGRPMPGAYSAPLLVGAAIYLLFAVERFRRRRQR